MFATGDKVLRKSGNGQTGIVVTIRGERIQVAWQNAVNRISGNKVTRTWMKLDALIPYNENTAVFRLRAQKIKHAENNMKLWYQLVRNSNDERNRTMLEKYTAEYNRLMNSAGDYSYGVCQVCEKDRLLNQGICGTCAHRQARRINTREMYGKGRRNNQS